MASFQVVAVYPSGTRFPIREPHAAFIPAEAHRDRCEQTAHSSDTWVYEIDVSYRGADGQRHGRRNVSGESLGYSSEEVDAMHWDCP